MEKALRRQAGASDVDMDMEKGYAVLTLGEPAQIDVAGLAKDLDGAGYTLKTLELNAEGTVVGEGDERFVELAGTKQRFELQGKPPPKLDGPFRGSVEGWDTDRPRIKLLEPGG